MKVKSVSRVHLFATPWTAAHQAPPSMGFSRQEYWSGVPLSSPSVTVSLVLILRLQKRAFYHYVTLTKLFNFPKPFIPYVLVGDYICLGGGDLVTKSCLTLCNPMDCSPSGSSVHEISQARILEQVAIFFSRGSS